MYSSWNKQTVFVGCRFNLSDTSLGDTHIYIYRYIRCSRQQPYDPTFTGKLSHFPRRKVHASDMTAVGSACIAQQLPRIKVHASDMISSGSPDIYIYIYI